MHADAAAGGTSEGRQPTVDFHRAHVCHAYAGDRAPAQDRAISHANRAYEVFGRHNGAIWEPLARLADVDASRTFRMAELLIEAALDRPHPHITFEQTQHVLACALAADDADTRDRSVQLIHTLGERGYVEFGQLLEGR